MRGAQLHRTFTHSLPLQVVCTLLLVATLSRWGAHPCQPGLLRSQGKAGDSAVWRWLINLAGGQEAAGPAVAAMLGACAGCVGHSLADIFYVVPVRLAWPHPAEFSYPLVLPAKEAFTNRLFKLAMLGDFASDALFFVPVVYLCTTRGLHAALWPRFARFWAFQLAVLVAHLHPALMDDRYHHEDFIYWLHAPCGMAFILTLFASPIMLHDAVTALTCPDVAAARAEAAAKAALALLPADQAASGVMDAAARLSSDDPVSPASSCGASKPADGPATEDAYPSSHGTARKRATPQRRRSWNAGMWRQRGGQEEGEDAAPHGAQDQPAVAGGARVRRSLVGTSASLFQARSRLLGGCVRGGDSSDDGEECSSPRKPLMPRRPNSFTVDHY